MRELTTQGARPDVVRDDLDFDVLFVGAGPANLAALWRLLDRIEADLDLFHARHPQKAASRSKPAPAEKPDEATE